jgi:hypothetical protein
MKLFITLLLLSAPCLAQPHLPPGTRALPSAAPGGRGPLALVNLHHHVLGHARVFDGRMPDLFVAGYGGPQAVHLFRWIDTSPEGAPVFAEPVEVTCAYKDKGYIFQQPDGVILGLWISKGNLVTTEFDRATRTFHETRRRPLPPEITSPASLGVLTRPDGGFDLAFEVSNNAKGTPGHPWTEEWRPFNSSGIATGERRYRYLMGWSAAGEVSQITTTKNEVYFSMHDLTAVDLGPGHGRDLVTGSRQGELIYYRNRATAGFDLEKKRLIAGTDGNALRHPSINPSVCAYPDERGRVCDLIACGEGSLYFYRFTGRFAATGAPVYAAPVAVLQENADLYAGTLPVPTSVDWNGDGVLDLLAGNSEGFVLFFENIGSNTEPRFLPATRVQAGGRDIHVQAGYAGSLQGLQESRWGYLSPNAFDWNDDGLPDLVTGDITGDYHVYLNRGTKSAPQLDPAQPLFCDGIPLHGMWRCRPALARVGERTALVLVDGDDHFHLYWRIDDFHVEDGGKLHLDDGRPIGCSGGVGGQSGRAKPDLFDWNGDGLPDLVIGTNRVNSIPDRKTGLPMPGIGLKTLGTPLLLLNTGTEGLQTFARPVPFRDINGAIIQPGGAHETGAVGTLLGPDGPNLLVCNEAGRLFLLLGKTLRVQTASHAR